MTFAVIKSGNKQYFVREGEEIYVDNLNKKEGEKIELETLLISDDDGAKLDLGTPNAKSKVSVQVLQNLKGDKVRVARFKSKTRYHKVKGFRAKLSKIKILKI
ncbi:50S ribosomal protein L21 [Candidatus Roizmanbacteria bacterium RIFCSPHIGHO2_02_FULL_37_13b]|uniref:Large ribosomal subunit protein bL21 n=1 Tax=Candidatus Roizmanbacteria bacterium RIFCSPLOWO2_02_FULL_36_11 TaxID=1802071 RepID=A0A1F7JG41_9BACT|nr:MAG: 50S ribosomal protein L21 [Candidatus Roizmanbacteria bacterium RIFCSPHIGHO2_02_FULL_37_13b]OGK54587.1 MAG: 50S ribosomal protein L21 [Candidatus Roizmanbacteria bacterium RIFCSPLOWO2_02_FULL_36_11]